MPDQEFYRLLDGPNGRQKSSAGGNKPGYWDEQQKEATGFDPSPLVPAHYFGGDYTGDADPNVVGNVGVSTKPSVDPVLVVKDESADDNGDAATKKALASAGSKKS